MEREREYFENDYRSSTVLVWWRGMYKDNMARWSVKYMICDLCLSNVPAVMYVECGSDCIL